MTIDRPLRVYPAVKQYQWGMKDRSCWVGKFADTKQEPPFAELWLGDHPDGLVMIDVPDDGPGADGALKRVTLPGLLVEQGERLIGRAALDRFGKRIPFLGKVLSVGDVLSIQVHPAEADAVRLNRERVWLYPDPYQKDEASVALTDVELLYGFRDAIAVHNELPGVPELLEAVVSVPELTRELAESYPSTYLRTLVGALLKTADGEIKARARKLYSRLQTKGTPLTPREAWIMKVREMYPDGDVGVFFFYLLNLVHLKPGEGIAIPARWVHVYLSGELVELMVPSNNVIRCGMTPKDKEPEEVLACASFEPLDVTRVIIRGTMQADGSRAYTFGNERYMATIIDREGEYVIPSTGTPEFLLSLDGTGALMHGEDEDVAFSGASAFFMPAGRGTVRVRSGGGKLIRFHMPA